MKPQISFLLAAAVSANSLGQTLNRFTPSTGSNGGKWSNVGLWSASPPRVGDSQDIVELSGCAIGATGFLDLALQNRQIRSLDIARTSIGIQSGLKYTARVSAGAASDLSLTLLGDNAGEFLRLRTDYTSDNNIFTVGATDWFDNHGRLTLRLSGTGDVVIEGADDTLDIRSVIADTLPATPGTLVKRGAGRLNLGAKSKEVGGVAGEGSVNTFSGGFKHYEGTVLSRQWAPTTLYWTTPNWTNPNGTTYSFSKTDAFGTGTFTAIGGKLDLNGYGFLNPVDLQSEIAFTRFEAGRRISALGGDVVISGASGVIRVDDANQNPVSDDGDESENTSAHQELHVFGKVSGGKLVKEGRRRLYISGDLEQRIGGSAKPNGNSSDFVGFDINKGEVVPSRVNPKNQVGPMGHGIITINGGKLGYYNVATGQTGTPNFIPKHVSESDREVVIGANDGEIQVGSATTSGNYDLKVGSISGPGKLTKTGRDILRTDSLALTGQTKVDLQSGTLAVNYTGLSPADAYRALLIAGRNSGTWDGTGIISTTAQADASTAIGYVDTGSSIKMRYIWLDDADLDADVDFNDLLINAQYYNQAGDWSQGDSNYDSMVDFADLLILAQLYPKTANELRDEDATLPGPAVIYLELYYSFPHIIDDARNHEELWAMFKPWEYLTSGATEFAYVPVLPTLMPEPATVAMVMGAGLVGLARRRVAGR